MRYCLEPIGWLVVCLMFVAALAVVVAPLGFDSRAPAPQPAAGAAAVGPKAS